MRLCSVPDCIRPHLALGFCSMHYGRFTNKGAYRSPNDSARKSKWQAELRAKALNALGSKCFTCGFSDYRALQIDHKNSDGPKHRKSSNWSKLYKEVIGGSEGFTLLCANCNWIKRAEKKEAIGRPRTVPRPPQNVNITLIDRSPKPCIVPECTRKAASKGLCGMHYMRKKHGKL